MLFFYDRTSNQSGIAQFNNFLDNQLYLHELNRDVKDVTNYQLVEVRKAIQRNTRELQTSINNSIKNICGSIEIGFDHITDELQKINNGLDNIAQGVDDINWRLHEINEGIASLQRLMDWKTDLIIEQQIISNNYLDVIARGVSLTSKEKFNMHYNKHGNIWLKDAHSKGPNSSSYKKAHQEFTKAHKNDPNDYYPLKQLGIIYYSSKELRDIYEAESHFKESAEIALVFSSETSDRDRLRHAAASSLLHASYCNYILGRLNMAIAQITQAIQIRPENNRYKFHLAKYQAANGNEFEATKILTDIIKREELYSIEILKDQDLITKRSIQEMLNQETATVINEVDLVISNCKRDAYNDHYKSIINKIESSFNPKTFITAFRAKKQLRILSKS